MQKWIVACIVALALFYLVRLFLGRLKNAKTPDCGCSAGCAGCQASSNCDVLSDRKDG